MDRDRLIAVTLGQQDIRDTMIKSKIFNPKTIGNAPSGGGGAASAAALAACHEGQSFKILVQQAEHELHRGAYARALGYLNKAVKVCLSVCQLYI